MLVTPTNRTNLPSSVTGDTNANSMAIPLLLDVVATKGAEHSRMKRAH
jgi:hypothetical protein